MRAMAIFLDFYGTLVHEDDDILPPIYEQIRTRAAVACEEKEIGEHWWKTLSGLFAVSYGERFKAQRELGLQSLTETVELFRSDCSAEELIRQQFEHWIKPELYEDTLPFLSTFSHLPIYILSNIDTADIAAAAAFHGITVTDIVTSEDVRAYKPRPELFLEGMKRCGLTPSEIVHIGDSYTSDVVGASALGIQTIWLNRLHKRQPQGAEPGYICHDLKAAEQWLLQIRSEI
ncbi:2-haloacid dehalogenase/putative hydrolase of the HAD superfamily [Paenibacillus catalpae]|uniref:2-haloacid dehalogenase/putative hydrolase of the HAD superfamily n=1 Tax=Paenibacillus catalpae TaxID=1045775 RepID=A0A1I1X470_9BACL|nr:HAD family hydrolase [Paenibacillus catalpae]SFE00120.1 2-haloacid dehalogenase/putative hydrolase of the HAD superfamily [Paenibacillus catalpae]